MHALRAVDEEPIPGYRLLEPLGKGGFGEVWKCSAPGGMFKAIKFVPGNKGLHHQPDGAAQELRALEHVKSLRHPFLLSIERIEQVDGDLVIVTELADRSLHDLLVQYHERDLPGIPRGEVLNYLREAAEVLDVLNHEHGLQHLDVKPRNLFLVGRHIKVADFGLVASLSDLGTREDLLGGITPLYAAPELFNSRATLFSDQYSLAVTYHELVTGRTPHQGRNVCQLAFLIATTEPDLHALPESDQPVVAKALAKEPRDRFPSCTAFLDALCEASPPGPPKSTTTTSFEFSLGDMGKTAVVPVPRASGVLRRSSRVVSAGQSSSGPGTEPLSGYQLLECLARGDTGELWRARAPKGEPKLVRFLVPPDPAQPGENPLHRLQTFRHPTLPRLEMLTIGPGRLALVSDAGESSLAARLKECRAVGQPGIPRAELLAHLHVIAQALDELYHELQIQHLSLTPRHIALRRDEPLLLEFGLAELLWIPQGMSPASIAPRYAALEMFDGLISDSCDQVSLALMFQELLVGIHPYRNLNARQMASPKLRGEPDLSLLPGPDRPIVQQAMDRDPEKRFRSCAEFILALQERTSYVEQVQPAIAPSQHAVRAGAALAPAWREALDELVQAASHGHQLLAFGSTCYRLTPGQAIEQRAWARLAPGMARLKLAGFCDQWHGTKEFESPSRVRMLLKLSGSLVERCLGRVPGLIVEVVMGTPRESAANATPVRISITPTDCSRGRAVQQLVDLGPNVLTSLRTFLGTTSDKPSQERYPLSQLVQVQSPAAGLAVSGQLRDIGKCGLTIRTKTPIPVGAVTVTLNRWASPATFQLPGRVCDCIADEKDFEIDITLAGV
jgi:serine/threonine protein kinase